MTNVSRRRFLQTVGAGLAGLALSPRQVPATSAHAKPNIVLILADDLGYSDLGSYGGEIETQNLDALAAGGMRFTQFYNTAKCAPTRCALLTGCYHREVQNLKTDSTITLAQAMRWAGYTTLMTGKWHLSSTPLQKGFDRYFGHLSGATNYFIGDDTFRLDDEPFEVPKEGFYTTDANTDYAIRFLDEASKKDKPFFLYMAYNAPHYPLQAPRDDIEKYRGRYMKGWDQLRRERHQRQLQMGLVKSQWKLTPRDDEVVAWEILSDEKKQFEDLTMATYAAMVDRLDRNIGRLITKIKEMGVWDNTLLLFLSDNGACPFQRTKRPEIPPWRPDSYLTYHKGWAQLCNTPFRLYKQNQHEGGISTPLIVHWPGVINANSITDQPGHLIDVMATLLDITGTSYPSQWDGHQLRPLRGRSLLPILKGQKREPHPELFFEFARYKGLRAGRWKIAWYKGPWELYDVEADRTELDNLADKMPQKVAELAARHEAWVTELTLPKANAPPQGR
jgi:arylsulfatase A-like enzyme